MTGSIDPAEKGLRIGIVNDTNFMIEQLPGDERRRLLAGAERITLEFGDVLERAGDRYKRILFPTGVVISLAAAAAGRQDLELEMVGNSGMHGATVILGLDAAPLGAKVRRSGTAWQLSISALREELRHSPVLHAKLRLQIHACLTRHAQAVGCAHFHRVEARLATLLSRTVDCAGDNHIELTHEWLARILGARRVSITQAATALQACGSITYHRGSISVLSRRILLRRACSCYREASA
ncbi:helix-turn-helix domain-containing protein [Aquabacterium sp. A7-Y]|uniref:Crp/Fnr family transcriptional regulator n=1 Tax=Aquabacterium sp. A7-Y TaxID=1349605 RepID=UPI00223E4295|nr:helix-turn-helix domain-containing protein [Aquabacterium sp. A7-Y]MCW7541167.1 helix-turn-helix domain-containing protein [Aquabacterium sp. A7-Y]